MLLLWTLIIERFIYFTINFPEEKKKLLKYWHLQSINHKNKSHPKDNLAKHRLRSIIVLSTELNIRRYLPLIKVLVALSPLLGLLGTVTGMILVFDTLSVIGVSSAKAIAAGVYKATIPTMAGMIVALSGLFASGYLNRHAQRQVEWLQEQLI
ncbi:MAG: MotA/TolQ/ExbB proton channel family protein [Pseudomonadales bacterium]|nr:MotA/TolQ/ExbB proton channel family protein [Pseudomonadales bacterium]